ncbi:MAG: glycosyltransferase family 4 protein, partial [Rhodospirillales bacterium]|nr:glycosyltransferase family 4 protein [Acetobacter sp.]
MKIAVSFPGCHRRAGVERVMVECLNFLAGRGHETHAFAGEWDHTVLRPEVICHHVPVRGALAANKVANFRRDSEQAASLLKPEIMASFGVAAPAGSVVWMQSVHAAWLAVSKRTRTFRERLRQRFNPFHPMILRAERQMLTAREYRRLIALTPEVRDDLITYYGVPAADVDVLPNGFSRDEFNPENRRRDREPSRLRLGIPQDATVILFVANETARKGLPQLLRAVARFKDKSLHVVAAGRFDPVPSAKLAASCGIG